MRCSLFPALLFDTTTIFSLYMNGYAKPLISKPFFSPFSIYPSYPVTVDSEHYLPIYLPIYLSPSLLSFRLFIPCLCSECILCLN